MKENSPLLTIVVPVYNSKHYLKECVNSIINNEIKNNARVEIILVDDGSSDGSAKACDEYSQNNDNIEVVHLKNGGVSKARNFGLKLATGKYVWFVDSDDILLNGALSNVIETITTTDFDIYIFGYLLKNKFEGTNDVEKKKILKMSKKEAIHSLLDPDFATFPWNKIFKKSLIIENSISFPNKMIMCEDMEFCYMVFDKAKKFLLTNSKLYGYRKNGSGASFSKSKAHFKDAAIANFDLCEYIEKNYPEYFGEIFKNTVVSIVSYLYKYNNSDSDYLKLSGFIKTHETQCYKLSGKLKIEVLLFLHGKYIFDIVGFIKILVKKILKNNVTLI